MAESNNAVLTDAVSKLTEIVVDLHEKQAATPQAPSEQLAEILDALRANQQPREVRFGDPDYQARLRATVRVFPRPVFQNGFDADPSGQSLETLAQIADIKPGKYMGGVVEVVAAQNDGINFCYSNRSQDQRMTLMRHFTSFADLVGKVWAESQKRTAAA